MRESTMQCYEFEIVRTMMRKKLVDSGVGDGFDALDICDLLTEAEVTSVEQLADIVSLARNLQAGVTLAA